MSIDIYFEIVAKPQCSGLLTSIPENLNFTDEKYAKEWEKEIGLKCQYQYRTINLSEAGEKMFGKTPHYTHYLDGQTIFVFADGKREYVTEEQLQPYYYLKTDDGYVYEREIIDFLENPYFFSDMAENGFVSDSDLDRMIYAVVGDDNTYYAEDLFVLLRAKRALAEGYTVVCRKE